MNFRHRNTTTALTAQNGLVLKDTLRDECLSNRSAYNVAAKAGRDFIDGRGCRDIGYNCPYALTQPGLCRKRECELFGKRFARLSHDTQTLTISIMCKPNVGASRFHDGSQLGHSLRHGLGRMRERRRRM